MGRDRAPRVRDQASALTLTNCPLLHVVPIMAPRTARHKILSEIVPIDAKTRDLRIVIETPKGSRNKYSYDPDCDCMQLSTVLPEGMVFPYDFGFIPSTLGDDDDPLDILILMEAPVVPGCIVRRDSSAASEPGKKKRARNVALSECVK